MLRLFARSTAGRALLETRDADGAMLRLQQSLSGRRWASWRPGSGAAISSIGLTPTVGATLSHPAPSTASLAQSIYRTQCQTAGTAGSASGVRDGVNTIWRGDAAGRGGFFLWIRLASGSVALAGAQVIAGLSSNTALLAGEPSALPDVLGLLKDTADANWFFARRTGTGQVTKVNLNVAYAANQVFDVVLHHRPGGTAVGVLVLQHNYDGTYTTRLDDVYSSNLPAATTMLGRHLQVRNGTTASAANVDLIECTVDSAF